MSTYKIRLQYRQVFETEIEIEAETTVAAIDAAKAAAKREQFDYEQISKTDPVMVSIKEQF